MLGPLIILFLTTTHGSLIRRFGDPLDRIEARIKGGEKAPDGLAPYQVSLRTAKHICGGTILNDRWVLTSADCILRASWTPDVVTGIHNLNNKGVVYTVEKKVPHPKFDEGKLTNDIALLKLAKNIEFTDKVKPIGLPTKDTEAGANLMVTGWGWSDTGLPKDLQMLNQTAVSHDECKKRLADVPAIPTIVPTQLCAYNDVNRGACQGDTGGPLVEGNKLVGVMSFGKSCALGYPDVYTRVYSYLDWISDTMKTYE